MKGAQKRCKSETSSAHQKLDALTSARGLAALLIVFYHYLPLAPRLTTELFSIASHGYLAVDLFFVLSGFVMAMTYFEKLQHPNGKLLFDFYLKRVARIYPLHIFILLAYLSVPLALMLSDRPVPSGYDLDYFFLSLFLVQNWGFTDALQWNVPAWSISTEFAAYLLFPAMVLALGMFKRAWAIAIVMLFTFFMIGMMYSLANVDSIGNSVSRMGVARCTLAFSAGVCLQRLHAQEFLKGLPGFEDKWLSFGVAVGTTATCVLLLANIGVADYWLVPATCVAIIHILVTLPPIVAKVMSIKALVVLGEMSFSIYLLHYLLRALFKLLFFERNSSGSWALLIFYFVTLLSLSWLTWRFLEIPARRRIVLAGRRFTNRRAYPDQKTLPNDV